MKYEAGPAIDLRPGDILVMCTDGVTESTNTAREMFGSECLHEIIQAHHSRSAAEIVDGIADAVRSFCGKQPQTDDITVTILKRLARK